LEYLSCSRR